MIRWAHFPLDKCSCSEFKHHGRLDSEKTADRRAPKGNVMNQLLHLDFFIYLFFFFFIHRIVSLGWVSRWRPSWRERWILHLSVALARLDIAVAVLLTPSLSSPPPCFSPLEVLPQAVTTRCPHLALGTVVPEGTELSFLSPHCLALSLSLSVCCPHPLLHPPSLSSSPII